MLERQHSSGREKTNLELGGKGYCVSKLGEGMLRGIFLELSMRDRPCANILVTDAAIYNNFPEFALTCKASISRI